MTDTAANDSLVSHVGPRQSTEELFPLLYDELRRLARQRIAREAPGQTLEATSLVHEVFVRLADGPAAQNWDSRGHFLSAAAEAMRRILIDIARRKKSIKRGGDRLREDLQPVTLAPFGGRALDVLALDEALCELERTAPEKAQLVKLRFFAGLKLNEAADALGISPATAKRYWVYARAWLYGQLAGE